MKRSLLIGVLGTSLILWSALHVSHDPVFGMADRPPVVGSMAPDFQLADLDGNPRSLSAHRGQVVLLNFWATWCKPCTKEMPAMQAAYDELRDQGFIVIAINELEDIERVRAHIREHGHTFPVWMDPDNQVANMYGVVGLPVSVFIDENGRVHEYVKGGGLTKEKIHHIVARMDGTAGAQPAGS